MAAPVAVINRTAALVFPHHSIATDAVGRRCARGSFAEQLIDPGCRLDQSRHQRRSTRCCRRWPGL